MARAKTRYRTKAEKQAALDQADAQFNRARGILNDLHWSDDRTYMSSQRKAYFKAHPRLNPRSRNGIERSGNFAGNKYMKRFDQLNEAYTNRINAIKSAAVGG